MLLAFIPGWTLGGACDIFVPLVVGFVWIYVDPSAFSSANLEPVSGAEGGATYVAYWSAHAKGIE